METVSYLRRGEALLIYMAIGAAAGIVSGMGIGGGVILIPALTMILGAEQHSAQGANLIYFIPTAVAAIFTHAKNKAIETKLLKP
jgi:uncharacterized membrane protein YfcA